MTDLVAWDIKKKNYLEGAIMLNGLLASDLADFLSSWYGILIFVLIDIAVALLIVVVLYRWFFKYFFDFIIGLLAAAVTSPVWLITAIVSKVNIIKTNEYQKVFTTRLVAGKGGKTIRLHSFTVVDGVNGELTKIGKVLRDTRIEKIPAVFDLLSMRMSIVGVKPLSITDEKFIYDVDYDRFAARPGYVNPLVTAGDNTPEPTYEDMFHSDKTYAAKCGFFRDIGILLTALVHKIRGDKRRVLGEATDKDYVDVLLERGEISQETYDEARAEEAAEIAGEEIPDYDDETEDDSEASSLAGPERAGAAAQATESTVADAVFADEGGEDEEPEEVEERSPYED